MTEPHEVIARSADQVSFSVVLLAGELQQLKRRTFGQLSEQELGSRLPALAAMARALHPVPDSAAPALRKLMRVGVAEMEDRELGAAAAALFGLAPESYGMNLTARQNAATTCFTPRPSVSTFRQSPQYSQRVIEELAAALGNFNTPVTPTEMRDRQAGMTIARTDLLAEAQALLRDAGKVLWIWGEPGTGKTVLAQEIAGRVRTHLPVVTVRLGNSHVAEADVLSAVGHDGVDARSWSQAACRLHFREMLEAGRSVSVVVIDGVIDEPALWELVPDTLRVPLIVTSRTRSDHGSVACLKPGAYTPEQARAVVGLLLPHLPADDAEALSAAVGHHPLLVDRICRHVLGGSGHSVDEVSQALVADLLVTLDAVGSLSSTGVSLTRVYQKTLAALREEHEGILEVLASILWISSGGSVPASLADDYLRHRFSGAVGALQVTAARRILARWAIVSEENDAVVMHPLTAVILQNLLADSFSAVVTDLLVFLRTTARDSTVPLTRRLHHEVVVMDHVLRVYWGNGQSLLCLASDAWLWFDHTGRREPIRYEAHEDGLFVRQGGTWGKMAEDAALDVLVEQTQDYYRAQLTLMRYRVPRNADAHVSEPDGFAHFVRRGGPAEDGLTQAVCGKIWVRSAADVSKMPICARCSVLLEPYSDRTLGLVVRSLPFRLHRLVRRSGWFDRGSIFWKEELLPPGVPSR
ncbi:hypothetical protein ACFYPA_27150 [Streptomyces sp. NPDC005775]|uniref:hypothetical protein n=1 Tax=Streptomyces sp. NPDC005775 TaxID=3364729 RepID=UPI003673A71A